MLMSEPRFIGLVDAAVAVVGCGSTYRVSDLELEVRRFVSLARFSLAMSHFRLFSGGIVSIGCMSSVSSLVSVSQEVRLAWLHLQRVLGELLSKAFGRVDIQGVWTEQRFPLSSYEVSGSWSYRLAGVAAAISVVWV
ncbi:hypothetical protein HID58_028335 [Brassica napus]|uniref:Uncharacterized protein n=1 Tax=Brassica napus TaxID=3708 RepID=A0ABQ8C9Y1_BRANA|nr:hypothetical protein HID58_028335 [Brassica napus]